MVVLVAVVVAVHFLACSLAGVGWLALAGWLAGALAGSKWLAGRSVGWLVGWLAGW